MSSNNLSVFDSVMALFYCLSLDKSLKIWQQKNAFATRGEWKGMVKVHLDGSNSCPLLSRRDLIAWSLVIISPLEDLSFVA